jgi:hypothetical protein
MERRRSGGPGRIAIGIISEPAGLRLGLGRPFSVHRGRALGRASAKTTAKTAAAASGTVWRRMSASPPAAAIGLAGDSVVVAVHLRTIAGLAPEEGREAGGPDLVAAGKIDPASRSGAGGADLVGPRDTDRRPRAGRPRERSAARPGTMADRDAEARLAPGGDAQIERLTGSRPGFANRPKLPKPPIAPT